MQNGAFERGFATESSVESCVVKGFAMSCSATRSRVRAVFPAVLWLLWTSLVSGQALDAIWVASPWGKEVYRIQRSGHAISSFTAPVEGASCVAVRHNGDVWFGSSQRGSAFAMDAQGRVLVTVQPGQSPAGLAVDLNGNIWCGNRSWQYFHYASDGRLLASLQIGSDSGPIAADSAGHVWLGNRLEVLKVDGNYRVLLTLSHDRPSVPAVDHDDNIYTLDQTVSAGYRLGKWSQDGTRLWSQPLNTTRAPSDVAVDRDNNVWVATSSLYVRKYSSCGARLGSFMTGGAGSSTIALDGMGAVWIGNITSLSVTKMTPEGTILDIIPFSGSASLRGDATGFRRTVFADPFGDVDQDGHLNNAEVVAHSNPFDGGIFPCRLTPGGDRKVGGTCTLSYEDQSNRAPGSLYVMACSFSRGPIPVGLKRRIDLGFDPLFMASFLIPEVFEDFFGLLDTQGQAVGTLRIPALSGLAGATVHASAVTLDPTALAGIRTIAPTASFKIGS
jgi:streptogramin lyase